MRPPTAHLLPKNTNNMDALEEHLSEEVQHYRHLYEQACLISKDSKMSNNSRRDIFEALGKDEMI